MPITSKMTAQQKIENAALRLKAEQAADLEIQQGLDRIFVRELAKLIEVIERIHNIGLRTLRMPNGKQLVDCTGPELRGFSETGGGS
jgi:hypothetical protein